jgi:hypothetical protein
LLRIAEWIAFIYCYDSILINSGVGVRDYYKKLGYKLNKNNYMEKEFKLNCRHIYMLFIYFAIYILLYKIMY